MAGSHGYRPPKIEGVRARRLGAETPSTALAPEVGPPAPQLRLEVRGEAFPRRAMPLLIRVGGRAHFVTDVSADGKTIACVLDEIPEEGAVIEVGYPPHQMTELPERFTAAMIDRDEPGGGS